jgi:hypothetical protein
MNSLPPEEQAQVASMVGEVLEVYEIEAQTAWVEKGVAHARRRGESCSCARYGRNGTGMNGRDRDAVEQQDAADEGTCLDKVDTSA